MKTENTTYMPDLDVLRCFAALPVFFWHYLHTAGMLTESTYVAGLTLFEEGHIGVSLLMALSGYLFFRLTYQKEIWLGVFAWNRVKRVGPLLVLFASWISCEWIEKPFLKRRARYVG